MFHNCHVPEFNSVVREEENRDVHVTKKVLTTMRTAVSAFGQHSVCAEEGLPQGKEQKLLFNYAGTEHERKVGITPPLSSPGRSTKRAKNCVEKKLFSPSLSRAEYGIMSVSPCNVPLPTPPRTRKPKINCPELGEVLKCPF